MPYLNRLNAPWSPAGGSIDPFTVADGDETITQSLGTVFITKTSAAALTLADPTAGPNADDGKKLLIVDATGHAHTVDNSAGSGFNGGGAGSDVATFSGTKGDSLLLIAYGGKWHIQAKTGVTLG